MSERPNCRRKKRLQIPANRIHLRDHLPAVGDWFSADHRRAGRLERLTSENHLTNLRLGCTRNCQQNRLPGKRVIRSRDADEARRVAMKFQPMDSRLAQCTRLPPPQGGRSSNAAKCRFFVLGRFFRPGISGIAGRLHGPIAARRFIMLPRIALRLRRLGRGTNHGRKGKAKHHLRHQRECEPPCLNRLRHQLEFQSGITRQTNPPSMLIRPFLLQRPG